MLVLELGPNDLDWSALTRCQRDAADGLYAQAMAGFLRWLAPRYGGLREGLREEVVALREQARESATHRRTPEIVANLAAGVRCFLAFAQDIGAVTPEEASALRERCWRALGEAAQAQAQHQEASEPTRRFLELLNAAFVSGQAHIANMDGAHPNEPGSLGWRLAAVGTGENQRQEWRHNGQRVGWTDGDDLYLEPDASFGAVQRLGRDTGEALTVAPRTLRQRLHDRGLLVSRDAARGTLSVRRTIEGRRLAVLHLHRDCLSTAARTARTDQDGKTRATGQVSRSSAEGQTDQQCDQVEGYEDTEIEPEMTSRLPPRDAAGQVGQFANADTEHVGEAGAGLVSFSEESGQDPTGNPTNPADGTSPGPPGGGHLVREALARGGRLLETCACGEAVRTRTSSGRPVCARHAPPGERCYACGSPTWWARRGGGWVCSCCHPPPGADAAIEELKV